MTESSASSSGVHLASGISFYSVSSPSLVSRIQSKIRVEWHWDRDDEVDPRSDDTTQLMRRGCHMIVQMQVAEQQDSSPASSSSSVDSTPNPSGCGSAEEEDANHHPEKKQKLNHSGANNATLQTNERTSKSIPESRICNLDGEDEERIWSSILTPTVLSRATILLPHSARFHRLFYYYYDLFIAQQQSEHEWRTGGCPVWMYRFDLNLFHSRLDAMRSAKIHDQQEDEETYSSITECMPVSYSTPVPASLEWDLIRRWRRKLASEFEISSIPHRFPIYIANYSNESCTSPSSVTRWQGDLLVLPLRTIHAVLDASPLVPVMRLKFFLGFYSALPSYQTRDRTGFAIGHGPGRHEAREFERQSIEEPQNANDEKQGGNGGQVQTHAMQQWKQIRLDMKAWQLWGCDSAASNEMTTPLRLPIGQEVQRTEKSSDEIEKQRKQSALLLQDLERDSCSLLHGVFPPSLHTASKILQYLHDLMRLPADFSLTSLSHARAFHDSSLRKHVGLQSHHLRRDVSQFESTHVQASHGNTAYGAYAAGAVEAALYLEPFVDTVWNRWNLGQGAPSDASLLAAPPKLFTIEVGYQAPLPLAKESRDEASTSSSTASKHQSHPSKRSRAKRNR